MKKFDFKQAEPALYQPRSINIVEVGQQAGICFSGSGDPNLPDGDFKRGIKALYALAYTLKMKFRSVPGYLDYVVAPLEGFWWFDKPPISTGVFNKADFHFTLFIRQPDFFTPEMLKMAKQLAAEKGDVDAVEWIVLNEGLCIQGLHVGTFDSETLTINALASEAQAQGYELDYSDHRHHHEIYLSDFRRVRPESYRTTIRLPIRKSVK